MRRRTALACVALGLVAGAGTGIGLRSAIPSAAVAPARPGRVSAAPQPGTPTPAARALGRDDLVTAGELEAAAPRGTRVSTTVTSDEVDPVVSPCQQPGPFTGLAGVVVGRWQGPDGRVGEVIAQASSVDESRRRANEAYEQHLRCGSLTDRTVGARHAIAVDGGSITWFEVSQAGRPGLSAVVRQSDRFAVVYADASQVSVDQLPGLLRDAATRLR